MTFGRDDEVVCMTTSADCSRTPLASPETLMPHGASRGADDLSEILAHFGGVRINGADQVDRFFFAEQLHDGGPNRADSVLDGTNFLFHGRLRFLVDCERTERSFAEGEPSSVLEFAGPFNRGTILAALPGANA